MLSTCVEKLEVLCLMFSMFNVLFFFGIEMPSTAKKICFVYKTMLKHSQIRLYKMHLRKNSLKMHQIQCRLEHDTKSSKKATV